jgi:hypothetical protein
VHRSRLHVLVVLAAAAACSAPKDPERTNSLARDTALVAHMADFKDSDKQTANPFPDACGTFTIASPTAANKTRAQGLARRAYNAEILGKVSEASSLLREASQLDATDKSAAYHLGRVSEAMNDRSAAIAAYCRYLALAPTKSEQLEARQRVVELAQSQTPAQTQAQSQVAVAPPSAPRTHSAVETAPRVVAKHPVDVSTRARPTREIHSTSAIASGAVDLPPQTGPASAPATTNTTTTSSAGETTAKIDAATNPGDGVDTSAPLPTVEQPRTDRRGPSRVQSAGIGAVAGAIIGRVAGRDMKSAAIGAVAGGILGAVVVHPRGTGGFAPGRWPR